MNILQLVHGLLMGAVEGLTEFLPVSSTGHLIVVGDLIGMNSEAAKSFEIAIQSGAILAVAWLYRQRLLHLNPREHQSRRFLLHLLISFLPAAVLGLLLIKTIKAHLFAPVPVAIALIVGALLIFHLERRAARVPARITTIEAMSWRDALFIGCAQCLSLIPGTSRSASTILGGMWIGLSRAAATEYSFFLALPVLGAASLYELWKARHLLTINELPLWIVGFVTSFVVALITVKWLLRYVAHHTFRPFAWYRIAFGLLVLLSAHLGWVTWND